MPTKQARQDSSDGRAEISQRFRVLLALLVAWALLAQGLILQEAWQRNPFASLPLGDALAYWDLSGAIASGRLIGDAPYAIAPLYAWFQASLRAIGLDLLGILVVQVLLYAMSVALIAVTAARRFGPATGIVAGILMVLARSAAYVPARGISSTLQVLTVAWLLYELVGLEQDRRPARAIRSGFALGVGILAFPPLIAALPVLAAWTWPLLERGRRGLRAAAMLAGVAILCVAPATLHNLLAAGELVPVSVQAGVTFAQGNAPGARGTFQAIEGVSAVKHHQERDALELARSELGAEAGWRAADAYFWRRGLSWWAREPADALVLAGRKAYWFVSARHYGESFLPAQEVRAGLASRLVLAPLPVAWLTLPALAAAALLARRWRKYTPELVSLGVPLLVCVVFYYSSRYRLPAVPAMALLAAWSVSRVTRPGGFRLERGILGGAWLVALALGPLNAAIGFDRADAYRGPFESNLGAALLERGDLPAAREHLEQAISLGHAPSRPLLAETLRRQGARDEALALVERALAETPDDTFTLRTRAVLLLELERYTEALAMFERVTQLDPRDWQAWSGLAGVQLALERPEEALEGFDRALSLVATEASLHFNRGCALDALERDEEALEAWHRALGLDPRLTAARWSLADLHAARKEYDETLALLEEGLSLDRSDLSLANRLAWYLAVVPGETRQDVPRALELCASLATAGGDERAEALDVFAAALAAAGRFDEAAEKADRALDLARRGDLDELVAGIEERAQLYRTGRAYRLP